MRSESDRARDARSGPSPLEQQRATVRSPFVKRGPPSRNLMDAFLNAFFRNPIQYSERRKKNPVKFKYPIPEVPFVPMPKVELTIPEHLEMQIAQLVEQGEFVNREEAIEDLLSTGLKAYKTSGPMDDEEPGYEDDGMMGHDDEYVF